MISFASRFEKKKFCCTPRRLMRNVESWLEPNITVESLVAEIHDVLATFCVSSGILQIPGFGSAVAVARAVAGCEEPATQELKGCSDGYTKFHVSMEYWTSNPAVWAEVTRLQTAFHCQTHMKCKNIDFYNFHAIIFQWGYSQQCFRRDFFQIPFFSVSSCPYGGAATQSSLRKLGGNRALTSKSKIPNEESK